MKRILVPTDFSTPSKASFRFAIDLASRAHAAVYVVHMVNLPLLPETTFGLQPYPLDPEVLQKAAATANSAFEAMKKQFPSDVDVHFKAIHDYVVPGIREYITGNKIDLVVMSTHGASNLQEFFIGSTAEKIARFSPVPVISIPQEIKTGFDQKHRVSNHAGARSAQSDQRSEGPATIAWRNPACAADQHAAEFLQ